MSDSSQFVCPRCNAEVLEDDDFCPHCGEVFADGVSCTNHSQSPAAGVCIICGLPFCGECGLMVEERFLCHHHSTYDIHEGMVRVYSTLDDSSVQDVKSRLEAEGLHPVILVRSRPQSRGRTMYADLAVVTDKDGRIVSELKIMVPCDEVDRAEKVISSLSTQDSSGATT